MDPRLLDEKKLTGAFDALTPLERDVIVLSAAEVRRLADELPPEEA